MWKNTINWKGSARIYEIILRPEVTFFKISRVFSEYKKRQRYTEIH